MVRCGSSRRAVGSGRLPGRAGPVPPARPGRRRSRTTPSCALGPAGVPPGPATRRPPGGTSCGPGTVQRSPAGAIGSHPMDTLTPAEVAQLLGTSPNRVRQLLHDRKLMAVPGSGNGKIPADFVQDGVILKHLAGLLTVLQDGGFSDEEAFEWLFRADDSLPGTPVQALRDDRHTEVTRRAQALAL